MEKYAAIKKKKISKQISFALDEDISEVTAYATADTSV